MSRPATLNPFTLWRQSFQWRGLFTRLQLFVLLAANAVIGLGVPLLVSGTSPLAARIFFQSWMMVALATTVGAVVRRLRDLGWSAWLVALVLVPCANLVFFFYLLLAPRAETAEPAPLSLAAFSKAIVVTLALGLLGLSLPGLLRARIVANENAAIDDLRGLAAAQIAYAERNGGAFEGQWECLAQPATCLPGNAIPPLLEPSRLQSPRMGYLREFHRGPAAARPPGRSATSIRGFAIVARPESRDGRTFCTDTSGRLCAFPDGAAPITVEATREYEGVRCAARCLDLR